MPRLLCWIWAVGFVAATAAGVQAQGGNAEGAGQAKDLLAGLDVKKQQVAGEWKWTQKALESPVGERQRLELPGDAPEEYQLQVVVERAEGEDAFCIGLVVGGRQTCLLLDGYASTASGLHLLDGKGCNSNATSYQQPIFAPAKRVDVRVTVRRGEVSAQCDGVALFTWRGDPEQLTLYDGWKVRNPKALFLASNKSTYLIHAVRILPVGTNAAPPALANTAPLPGTTPATGQPAPGLPEPAEVKPPLQTGAFELERRGISTQLYLHVLKASIEPAHQSAIQNLQSRLDAASRAEKTDPDAIKAADYIVHGPDSNLKVKPQFLQNVSWTVYVPKGYDGSIPHGVIGFINSGEKGSLPNDYRTILDKHRLIWISPDISGNTRDTCWRMSTALDGLRRLRDDLGYEVDPDRIYISGFSGGGRVASNISFRHPEMVTGGIYFAGVNYFRDVQYTSGNTSITSMASVKGMTPAALVLARQRRHVLIVGDRDRTAGYVTTFAPTFVEDGFKQFQFLKVPGLDHSMPPADVFDKAVQSLDAPLTAAAQGHFTAAEAFAKRGALGKAVEGYYRAAAHGGAEPYAADALQKGAALKAQYAEAVASIDALIDSGEVKAISAELIKFRRVWDPIGAEEAKRLAEKQKNARLKK